VDGEVAGPDAGGDGGAPLTCAPAQRWCRRPRPMVTAVVAGGTTVGRGLCSAAMCDCAAEGRCGDADAGGGGRANAGCAPDRKARRTTMTRTQTIGQRQGSAAPHRAGNQSSHVGAADAGSPAGWRSPSRAPAAAVAARRRRRRGRAHDLEGRNCSNWLVERRSRSAEPGGEQGRRIRPLVSRLAEPAAAVGELHRGGDGRYSCYGG